MPWPDEGELPALAGFRATVERYCDAMESLAVLPLTDLAGDPEQEFVSAGVHEALGFGYGAKDYAEAKAIAETFTLKGVSIDCPLLVVHSGQDTVCPVEESEKIAAVAGAKAEMVIFPDGNHVCDNIPYKVRPLMADWMADKLGAGA